MQRLAFAIPASAWVRSSTNRERESCRRHPYQMLSLEKDDTHTPSLCAAASLSCQGITVRPPFNCPPIQRTNWNASRFPAANHRRQYFHQIIVESSSSIFCPKTDNTPQLGGGAAAPARVSICKRQLISTYVCVFNNSSELHMKSDPNNSARKLYIFRTISNPRRCHRTQHICPPSKEIGFLLTRTYYFLVTLFLFFPAFSC